MSSLLDFLIPPAQPNQRSILFKSSTVRLVVPVERLQWFSENTIRTGAAIPFRVSYMSRAETTDRWGNLTVHESEPYAVTFESVVPAELFNEWQWSADAQRRYESRVAAQKSADLSRSVEGVARTFAALQNGLISAETARGLTKQAPQSFAVPLTRAATEARSWIKFNMAGDGYVDADQNRAVFKKLKAANRFSQWQKRSRRGGFGGRGLRGGRL